MLILRSILILMCVLWGATQGLCQSSDEAQATLNAIKDLEAKIAQDEKMLADLEKEFTHAAVDEYEVTSDPVIVTPKPVEIVQRTAPRVVQEAPKQAHKEHQVELATELSYISYKEPSLSMKETGPFIGVYGAYNYRAHPEESWPFNVLHLDGHLNYGKIDYESPDGEANNISDYLAEPRLWLGRDVNFGSVQWTPYGGIGYRFLFDHFGEVGWPGYDRRSQYLYAPVGFELKVPTSDEWQIGLNAEYDIFIRGWQTSFLSDAGSNYPDLNNTQRKGYGLRGSLSIIKITGETNWVISPYFRYWHIQQSDTSTAENDYYIAEGYEPENKSLETGVKVGVQF